MLHLNQHELSAASVGFLLQLSGSNRRDQFIAIRNFLIPVIYFIVWLYFQIFM